MLVASFFSELVTIEAALATGAVAREAARFGVGGVGVAAALALVVFFGVTACRWPRTGFATRALGLRGRAAPFVEAARPAFVRALAVVPTLFPFGLGM